jgi:hypothetical protein
MFTQSPVKIWRNQKKIRNFLGKIGTIQSFTIIRIPPVGYEPQAPYPVVLVDFLPPGRHGGSEKLVGQLVDYEQKHIKIGQKVQAVLRKTKDTGNESIIPYGVKFKPI